MKDWTLRVMGSCVYVFHFGRYAPSISMKCFPNSSSMPDCCPSLRSTSILSVCQFVINRVVEDCEMFVTTTVRVWQLGRLIPTQTCVEYKNSLKTAKPVIVPLYKIGSRFTLSRYICIFSFALCGDNNSKFTNGNPLWLYNVPCRN